MAKESLDLNLKEIVLHLFTASDFFSSFFCQFLSFHDVSTFVKVRFIIQQILSQRLFNNLLNYVCKFKLSNNL